MKLPDLPDTSGDEDDDKPKRNKGKSGELVDMTSGEEVGTPTYIFLKWFDFFKR